MEPPVWKTPPLAPLQASLEGPGLEAPGLEDAPFRHPYEPALRGPVWRPPVWKTPPPG